MATRGTIALEFADGSIGAVYCHYDNYLSGTGVLLLNHWIDPFLVRDLIDGGDLSALGQTIGIARPFDNPHRWGTPEFQEFQDQWGKQCVFYSRDRGETGCSARRYKDWEHYTRAHQGEEYDYVLRRDGKWLVRHDATNDQWVDLAAAIAEEARETVE